MSDWKEISVDGSHIKWASVFSKAIKHEKLQYEEGFDRKDLVIKTQEQINRIVRVTKYKIVATFQDDIQSSITFFESPGDAE